MIPARLSSPGPLRQPGRPSQPFEETDMSDTTNRNGVTWAPTGHNGTTPVGTYHCSVCGHVEPNATQVAADAHGSTHR
jgi:hypothetical protein